MEGSVFTIILVKPILIISLFSENGQNE